MTMVYGYEIEGQSYFILPNAMPPHLCVSGAHPLFRKLCLGQCFLFLFYIYKVSYFFCVEVITYIIK